MKLNDLIENKKLELLVELVHKHSFSHTKMYLSQRINKLIYKYKTIDSVIGFKVNRYIK